MPTYLNVLQVAARYGVTKQTIYNMVNRGELPRPYHFLSASRWSLHELEAAERAIGAARFSRWVADEVAEHHGNRVVQAGAR